MISRTYTRYLFSIPLFLGLLFVNAQTKQLSPGRKKLTTSDFKGVPDEKENYLARTFSVISLKYFAPANCIEKGKIKLQVETNNTVSEKSWLKVDRIKSEEILNDLLSHEQGHYDIGQTFAIDLKNKISNTCFDKKLYKIQADSIFRSMNKYYDSLQRKYDIDTDHMRNKKMQSKWDATIASRLDEVRK